MLVELVGVEPVTKVELLVVGIELLVVDEAVVGVDEVEDVLVGVRLEELEELEFGAVRTRYAAMPATATIMITITATALGAIPPLFCSTKERARATLFKDVGNILTLYTKNEPFL